MAATSSSSTPSPSTFPFEYHVFLSFCGEDTRRGFTDHLYQELSRSGIHAFRDSEGLEKGKNIEELFGVIERSEIFIPILSNNYAHSTWCLKEIEKIVRVVGEGENVRILPVFHKIEPKHVRHQTGPFGAAFKMHRKSRQVEVQTLNEWREALRKVADRSGYESEKMFDGHEAPLVNLIAQRVVRELKICQRKVAEHPVGVESRAQDIIKKLQFDSKDAKMVGIRGMGGLGKTTVASAIYNKIYRWFESHCFIEGIREEYPIGQKGLVGLQRELVSKMSRVHKEISHTSEGTAMLRSIYGNKRVLIVLDDVDSVEQVRAVAEKQEWFHPGSRVIITTRDEGVINALHDWEKHKISVPLMQLDENESLELFSWHAFTANSPADGYEELSLEIVRALDGLPFAIETFASSLYNNKDRKDWNETINTLRGTLLDDGIYQRLKPSYDRLRNRDERSIFLDAACFFSGIDEKAARYTWEACGFSSRLSLKALLDKSLIKINHDGKLEMHHLLRETGRRIVEEEPGRGPEHRSRLWKQQEIMNVLEERTGTNIIEGISLSDDKKEMITVKASGFASMNKLRLLMINGVHLKGGYMTMPQHIKWLQWHGCPLKSLPRDFHLNDVAALDLSYSDITEVQGGNKDLAGIRERLTLRRKLTETGFQSLKFLDLTACNQLKVTPDISAFPGLEKLVLDCCDNLVKVHDSIANLKNLKVLSMSSCRKLTELPDCISHLTSLKLLNLENCLSIERLPDSLLKKIAW
ncbi:disease resistance protein RUN1-like [Nymphaea colorata]|nr:disease resistance protein RUN1-like [Nymphaea colorata]